MGAEASGMAGRRPALLAWDEAERADFIRHVDRQARVGILGNLIEPPADADGQIEASAGKAPRHVARIAKCNAIIGAYGDEIRAAIGCDADQPFRIGGYSTIDGYDAEFREPPLH